VEFVLDDVVRVLGVEGPALGEFPSAQLTALLAQMRAARRLDARLTELRDQGRLAEHVTTAGEEAVAIGAATAMEASDWLFPAGRDVAAVLARGVPLARWMAHALGTALDPAKARQRPDRFSGKAWRVVSANPHGSSQLVQAAGIAWAAKARGTREAVLALLDEVAVETGEFHNGLNFAGVFRAPVVFVARSRQGDVARRAFAYGVRPARVDGTDVAAVHRTVREALDRARHGDGPTLIEAQLTGGDDPIARAERHLRALGIADDPRLADAYDGAIAKALDEAVAAGLPKAETMFDDVFAEAPWHLQAQRNALPR
jgi:TPP-dependent pyruvate/acetoin dehydrogenase alpha subunit